VGLPVEALWAAPLIRFREAIETTHTPVENSAMSTATITPSAHPVAGMLTVTMEIPIAASPARVWAALTEQVAVWWPRDFLVAAQHMQFEARLGGRLFEEDANGKGALWYTVYGITPGVSIDLAGQLSPAYGGPVHSLLRLVLRAEGDKTVLEFTDAVIGNVGPNSATSLSDGWRAVFSAGLKVFVEGATSA
jgi:uncharacterized protein YndB with AHSA1/START domain